MPTKTSISRILAILLLILALGHMPYGYYVLLKWIICAIFAHCAITAHKMKDESWTWIFGVTAAIYNPIIPVHLGRHIWPIVNIASVLRVS